MVVKFANSKPIVPLGGMNMKDDFHPGAHANHFDVSRLSHLVSDGGMQQHLGSAQQDVFAKLKIGGGDLYADGGAGYLVDNNGPRRDDRDQQQQDHYPPQSLRQQQLYSRMQGGGNSGMMVGVVPDSYMPTSAYVWNSMQTRHAGRQRREMKLLERRNQLMAMLPS